MEMKPREIADRYQRRGRVLRASTSNGLKATSKLISCNELGAATYKTYGQGT